MLLLLLTMMLVLFLLAYKYSPGSMLILTMMLVKCSQACSYSPASMLMLLLARWPKDHATTSTLRPGWESHFQWKIWWSKSNLPCCCFAWWSNLSLSLLSYRHCAGLTVVDLLIMCWWHPVDHVVVFQKLCCWSYCCCLAYCCLSVVLLSCRPLLSPPVSSPPSSSFSCPLCLFWHQLQRRTNWTWPSCKRKSRTMVTFSLRWLSVQSTWSWPCSGIFFPLDFLIRWFLSTFFDQVVCVNFFQLLGTMRRKLALPWPS